MTEIIQYHGPLDIAYLPKADAPILIIYACGQWMSCQDGLVPQFCLECGAPHTQVVYQNEFGLTECLDQQAMRLYLMKKREEE